jgi:hypothetical protein
LVGLNRSSSELKSRPKAKVGASGAIAFPSLSSSSVSSSTIVPAATATLGSARTSSTRVSGTPGVAADSNSMSMSTALPVMRASVSA